jgi:tRNA G18 (ribose-2'-O)-methylase SpoU
VFHAAALKHLPLLEQYPAEAYKSNVIGTLNVLEAARRAGRRVIAIEDVGRHAPWEIDLTGPVLLIVGAEAEGIPQPLLAAADEIVRLPMAGFIASYNLQAAVAAVAAERFRQLAARVS